MIANWWSKLKSSWYRSFSLLWLLIIALQWVSYTKPFWLDETTAAVLLTLAAVAVLEILLPLSWTARVIVEAAVAVYLTYRSVIHYGAYVPDPMLTSLRDRLPGLASAMGEYLLFALGAAALLLAASWWVKTKARILLFVACNVTALAALDSFTPYILWQEIAWVMFAGMGWLVTRHLRNFQLNYPRGWSRLLEYPLKVIMNVAIIFSLVIVTGINMPKVRPTLPDPYEFWQDLNGTGTGFRISGKSVNVEPGSGTSTAGTGALSGYRTSDDNLGGGFNFDYTPVMTVTSDLRTYMRGETRNVYSGKGWTDDDTVTRGKLAETTVGQSLEAPAAPNTETRLLKQSVRILGNGDYPVFFGGYAISSVDTINGEPHSEGGLYWRSDSSELVWNPTRGRPYPQSYTVTSQVPVVPVQELSKQTFETLYGGLDLDAYLQLPNSFPERVKELARQVTEQGQTPYGKVALLQQYLQQTYPYSNQPDLSRSKSKDLVDSFLFEIKEGYCDYYSSALVTMARSLGIPARWIKGYAPGEQAQIPDNLAMQGVTNNNYTITNADAHSWAEVYFGDYGWVPVEATPGFNVPLLTQSETPDTEQADVPEEETTTLEPAPAGTGDGSNLHVGEWLIWVAGAILLAWAGFLIWQRRTALRYGLQRLRNGRPLTPEEKVEYETARWVKYAGRKGMLKEEHETLRESVGRWGKETPETAENLSSLLRLYERAKYSPEITEDKDWRSVYTEALRLRRSLRSRGRARRN
ncbi:DUF3488 and transglutaminase-like domain-containing protein [Paenibacillus sp. NFR01]|uniref:transglutaminase TgpA family protein n=1 Tax=Paenibacillus sp. NFR01 TaxID=1566279 RepID=UPI0008D53441|nr:DUF3488 and transglutaminase-like domain-containing protein [Paenibacillus sp. NFR01]SET90115.1 protein of unknown function [Paenibacillus sp. NFR01]